MKFKKLILLFVLALFTLSNISLANDLGEREINPPPTDNLGERLIDNNNNNLGERKDPSKPKEPVKPIKEEPKPQPKPQPKKEEPKPVVEPKQEEQKQEEQKQEPKQEESKQEEQKQEEPKDVTGINKVDLSLSTDRFNLDSYDNKWMFKYVKNKPKVYEGLYITDDNMYGQQVEIYEQDTLIFANMMASIMRSRFKSEYQRDRTPYHLLSPIETNNGYVYQAITKAEYADALGCILKNIEEDNIKEKDIIFPDTYMTSFSNIKYSLDEVLPNSAIEFGSWDKLDRNTLIKSLKNICNSNIVLGNRSIVEYIEHIKYKYPQNVIIPKSTVNEILVKISNCRENNDIKISKNNTAITINDQKIELFDEEELKAELRKISKEEFFKKITEFSYSDEDAKDSLPKSIIENDKGNCSAISNFIYYWLLENYPPNGSNYKMVINTLDGKEHMLVTFNIDDNITNVDLAQNKYEGIKFLENLVK